MDDSTLSRALYSSDSSLYRVVPQAVARPRNVDELVSVARAALNAGLPITGRGAGTSCAGNAVGAGLVVETRAHLNRILAIDPDEGTATVEPGVVQDTLQRAARPYGLRFGPDPSTSSRCTIGGMIGNNACGPRALGYGRTADNIVALQVLTGRGELIELGGPGADPLPNLRKIVEAGLGTIRTEFGRFPRQISGYSLEHLLPEQRFDVASFFAGTEGTLGIVTQATVRLVRDAPYQATIALGYPTMAEAADATTALLTHRPSAIEGMDRRLVNVVATRLGPQAVPPLPRGDGWVLVELVGQDAEEVAGRARALVVDAGALEGWIVTDPGQAGRLWAIRSDAAGLAGVALDKPAWPGWEDAAVPPAELGAYLRDFEALLADHGLHGLPYGHFGDGCVHCRIDFPLATPGGTERLRRFMVDAAKLVAAHGGSMSGEHGDGRARSELLPLMYSPAALDLFGQVKAVFDPDNLLNPGVLVDPRPLSADVRMAQTIGSPLARSTPGFVRAVHQCTGVGKCVSDQLGAAGVMCPSYQATKEEADSTRGRARVLQELVNGQLVRSWRSPEVQRALDLCLACKGCRRDCPTGVDMAAYKSTVLDHAYAGRPRPLSHYALGWLPRWGRMVTRLRIGRLANFAIQTPGLQHLVRWVAGVDQRRPMPRFRTDGGSRQAAGPTQSFQRAHRAGPTQNPQRAGRGEVAVWVDSFTDAFEGTQLAGLLQTLTAAGFRPSVISQDACCGLTWITTGQHAGARRQLRHALDVLYPIASAGIPIVGLEPSCLAVWRSDAAELLPDDDRVPPVAAGIHTLAELLTSSPGWTPPDLSGHTLVVQPHCHHASVLGWAADARLLRASGARVVTLGGCCGLAGNFGVERGHYEVSVKVAENQLLPALDAHPGAIVLADGFSCRKQVADLRGRRAISLGELLASHLEATSSPTT